MAGKLFPTAALALALSGCSWYYDKLPSPDDLMKAIPWFDHMVRSPAVHPYKRADLPRNTVKGSVPVGGGEEDWDAGNWRQLQYGFDTTAANRLRNPTGPGEAAAQGDTLYQTFCAVCHGSIGAGDGPVGPRVGAPSLLTPKARAWSDGYLYSLIRYGRGVMPLYGDKVYAPHDRWAIVNHLRKLQADAPPPTPATPAGGTTR